MRPKYGDAFNFFINGRIWLYKTDLDIFGMLLADVSIDWVEKEAKVKAIAARMISSDAPYEYNE